MDYSGVRLDIHRDLISLAKILAVALAAGLDVLAVSVGIGIARLAFDARVRLGFIFAGSEIAMQIVGFGEQRNRKYG
jgi:putative Mn2+ efflux pump MntP